MGKYKQLTDEMFRDMMQSDKGIREARYATGYGRWVDGKSDPDVILQTESLGEVCLWKLE